MTPTDPTDFDPTDLDPTDPAGGLPDPVLPPHHGLTARLMELASTVADHHEQLTGTTNELHQRVLVVEDSASHVAALLDRVAKLEPPVPTPNAPAGRPPDPDPDPDPEQRPEQAAQPAAAAVVAAFDLRVLTVWVRENLAMILERDIPASREPHWCRQWYRHSEAIVRLEASRRVWLDASSQNDGLSTFFHHLDYHLGVLMAERGPFSRCRDGRHTTEPLSKRVMGHEDPDETFYAEFERLRAATIAVIPTPPPPSPTGSSGGGPVPAPVPGTSGAGAGVSAAELTHRRNGLGR